MRILSLEAIETQIVYVCHSEGEWTRQNILVPLNEVCQANWFECVKNCNAAGFVTTFSHVYQEWSTIQRTSNQLDTVENIGVIMGQHPRGTLLAPTT
jgi:hypothetical protein